MEQSTLLQDKVNQQPHQPDAGQITFRAKLAKAYKRYFYPGRARTCHDPPQSMQQ